MSKKDVVLVAAGGAVTKPGGLRRFAGGCLVVLLIAALALAAGVWLLAAWASAPPAGLPCSPQSPVKVSLATGSGKPGKALRKTVEGVLSDSGRPVEFVKGDLGDLRLVQAFDGAPVNAYGESPVNLRAPAGASKAQIREALGDRLRCESTEATESSDKGSAPTPKPAYRWQDASPAAAATMAAVLAWWLVGPETCRLLLRVGHRAAAAFERWMQRMEAKDDPDPEPEPTPDPDREMEHAK